VILLDTHVLLWLAKDPAKLSNKASAAIREAARSDGIAISMMTVWELAVLAARGKVNLTGTVEAFVENITARTAIRPITPKVAALASQFPPDYPKDPSDRLIGATALAEGMALVSADQYIRRSGIVRIIW
jgi:PIN domain nuclease of toxin-antitoxin system